MFPDLEIHIPECPLKANTLENPPTLAHLTFCEKICKRMELNVQNFKLLELLIELFEKLQLSPLNIEYQDIEFQMVFFL